MRVINPLTSQVQHHMKLAWHFYLQERNFAHQRLLRWTQAILMLFIITLSLSSASIQTFLNENLQNLLGADAVLSQQQPLLPEQKSQLTDYFERINETQEVKATLTHNNKWQSVKLKAVDNNYPLQGELLTASSLEAQSRVTHSGPAANEIWLDARLIASLSIEMGDVINVAEKPFQVTRVLQHEPDRLMEQHNVDMRAMINKTAFSQLNFATDLINYRYLFEANNTQVSQLISWQKKHLPAASIQHKQGNHPLALFWKRTENFLGLASIILFFMAAIAINQLMKVHLLKDQHFAAVCKSLGASSATGIQVSFFKWLFSLSLLIPPVLLCALAFHWLIINNLTDLFAGLTWQFQSEPIYRSILASIAIFAVFQCPVWLSLHNASVAKLIRGEESAIDQWLTKLASAAVLIAIAFAYSDNGLLTFMLVCSVAVTISIMILLSWSTLTLGEKITKHRAGLMPFTFFMMKQRIVSKSTQILGIGLCAFLLLFTFMLLKDFGKTMTSYQRQHDGNLMVSQATKDQLTFIEKWAIKHDITIRQEKPYVYGKLIAINNQTLTEFTNKPSESMAVMSRAIRLHWSQDVPLNNKVVAGTWWHKEPQYWQQVSVEQEVMQDLGLVIGDALTFYVGQQPIEFYITASHVFKSGAGSITFWVQMPPSALRHIQAAKYSMASLEIADKQWPLLASLWQKFPTLRMVSLKELTKRFDSMLAMITKVISGFASSISLLGLVVILASIKALELKERKKNSIIMSFGFTKSTCLKLNLIEWLVTAAIMGVGALLGTYIAGLLIYQSQFSLTYQPNLSWMLITLITTLTLITLLGFLASKYSLRSSVRELMSETGS